MKSLKVAFINVIKKDDILNNKNFKQRDKVIFFHIGRTINKHAVQTDFFLCVIL